jgi:hypothetical protein
MQVCESGFEVLEVASYCFVAHRSHARDAIGRPDVQQKHVIFSLSLFSHRLRSSIIYYIISRLSESLNYLPDVSESSADIVVVLSMIKVNFSLGKGG